VATRHLALPANPPLVSCDARELLDAQRGEMLDDVDRMADDTRDRELAGRQLRSAPRFSFTLVPHCGP